MTESQIAHLYFVSGMYTHAQTDPINPSPPKMNPTLPPKLASSGLTRYLHHASAVSGIKLDATHGMTMLAIIPQSELTKMPIPTVLERSLAEPTSAKMTYPRGPMPTW